MTIAEAISKSQETMVLAAKHYADNGAKVYTAEIHRLSAGLAMKQVFKAGLEQTAVNFADVFGALSNHSAWRQKLVGQKLFPEPSKKGGLTTAMADLEAEFGEE